MEDLYLAPHRSGTKRVAPVFEGSSKAEFPHVGGVVA